MVVVGGARRIFEVNVLKGGCVRLQNLQVLVVVFLAFTYSKSVFITVLKNSSYWRLFLLVRSHVSHLK